MSAVSFKVSVGDHIRCLYPKHGRRNILCNHTGVVLNSGKSRNGLYVVIQNDKTGVYRTLSLSKMVSPKVES
jgi:hypothetical protein